MNIENQSARLQRGTQVAYIPRHARGDINHRDVQFGFVTSVRGDAAFCRYWSNFDSRQLRTVANSELTPLDLLVLYSTHPQTEIDLILKEIDAVSAVARGMNEMVD